MAKGVIAFFIFLLMLVAIPASILIAPKAVDSASPSDLEAAEPATTPRRPYSKPKVFVNFSAVRLLYCGSVGEDDWSRGTAVVIAPTILMTSEHVLSGTCIDAATGFQVRPYYIDKRHDFALAEIDGIEFYNWFTLSCEGFKNRRRYSAIGYMHGVDLVQTTLISSDSFTSEQLTRSIDGLGLPHLRILDGDIYRGMSGGPVVDEDGVVIGLNTATNNRGVALSRELRDTILCDSSHRD